MIEYLLRNGEGELAIELLTKKNAPSYDRMMQQQSTTLWEYFYDGFSHNHPMFGSVVGIFIRTIPGIDPTAENPGFSKLTLRPCFDCGLNYAKGCVQTPFGAISVYWEKGTDGIRFYTVFPYGIDADLLVNDTFYALIPGENEYLFPHTKCHTGINRP